jgi:oxygen-independent coproporphyrinogen-3 oxidase
VCPYCDFAVRTGDAARRRRFVDHLIQEIRLYRDYPLRFDTIYLGGGTPSSLEPADLARVIESARELLRFVEPVWIFLEANPEDISRATLEAWVRAGVRVLSLGVQSFDADQLVFLGRMHTPEQARRSVDLALDSGLHTVSIDLIYGLPGQTTATWRRQLDQVTRLGAHHLSCYQLTIHDRTRFGLLQKRGRLHPLPLDTQGDLFELTHRQLAQTGYQGYEVSNFAISPDHRSRHNAKYWDHTPYLGLGPAAHSYVDRRRWWNLRRTDSWEKQVVAERRPLEGEETLDARTLALESLMTGMRTHAGVDLEQLERQWDVSLCEANRELIERLERRELVRLERNRLRPTLAGLAVADSLVAEFAV